MELPLLRGTQTLLRLRSISKTDVYVDRRANIPIRYAAERDKAGVVRQLTTLTVAEFEALVPSVQRAFLERRVEELS